MKKLWIWALSIFLVLAACVAMMTVGAEDVTTEGSQAAFDGCYKTLNFGDPEAVATMFEDSYGVWDVTYDGGIGYTTFTSTGTDPYLRFMDSNNNQGDFGVVGYEAAYILVKYRTQANSQNKTEIGFFTNCGAICWGMDGSYVKAELVVNPAEGYGAYAWHYVKVDATAAWGGSNNALYAFRMDPLSEAVPGETIDIAEIKFFAQETYMLDYLEGLAEEGDEAAQDYFDRLPCTHSTTEIIPAVPATCTEDGLTEGIRCTDKCGEVLKAQRRVPASHDFSVDIEAKPATETEEGYTAHKKCANCDATEGKVVIPKVGHTFGRWTITVQNTCLTDGEKQRVCACGEIETEVIPATGHAFGGWITTDATCTINGANTKTCLTCSEVVTLVIPATGHKVGDPVMVSEPTCTQNGSRCLPCMVCGETLLTEFIPATGHMFGDWTVTDATCTSDGKRDRTCACGATENEVIPATGHDFDHWVITTQSTCLTDGEKERTCTCGTKETAVIEAVGHKIGDPVTVSNPTCTENGSRRLPCMVCDTTLLTEIIPATGHTFGQWQTAIQATATTDGAKVRMCACGEMETETIPATNPNVEVESVSESSSTSETESEPEIDTDTEVVTEIETESETEEEVVVTDTTVDIEPETEAVGVPESESDSTATGGDADTTQAPASKGGCRSAVGTVGVLLLAVAGVAAVTFKKRKD